MRARIFTALAATVLMSGAALAQSSPDNKGNPHKTAVPSVVPGKQIQDRGSAANQPGAMGAPPGRAETTGSGSSSEERETGIRGTNPMKKMDKSSE